MAARLKEKNRRGGIPSAGDDRHEGADRRHEPRQENGGAAVLFKELLAAPDHVGIFLQGQTPWISFG